MRARLRSRLGPLFTREGFRGPALTLLSGSAVALGVSYLAGPLLTRLYTDEQFALSGYFVTAVSILIHLASLHYEDAAMIPDRDEEAAGVLGLGAVLTTAFALLLTAAAWTPQAHALLALLGVAGLGPWLWLVGPALLFTRLTMLMATWLTRRRRFGRLTTGDVANKVSTTVTRLGAGLAGAGTGGLIGGYALAQVVSTAYYAATAVREDAALWRAALRPGRLRTLARRFARFPLFTMPAALLSALVARLPFLVLPWFFPLATLGQFDRAFSALAVPLGFFASAIAQVFFVHAGEAHRQGVLARATAAVHARLVMICLFPSLALVVAGPDVFAFVFSEPWRPAGVYARYVSLWLFVASVASPLTRLFDVLERQRLELSVSVVLFAAQATALVAGGRTGDALYTVGLVSAAGALVRVLQIGVLLRLARVRLRAALAPYARYVFFSLPGLAVVAAAQAAGRPWLTTLAVALGGGLYAALLLWKDRLLAAPGTP